MINGKDDHKNKMEVVVNELDYFDSKYKKHGGNIAIGKYSTRRSIVDPKNILCEARFDNIDVSPRIFSKSSYTGKVSFEKQSGRQSMKMGTIVKPEYAEGLSSGKDKLMSNLSCGITKFKRQEIRRIGEGFGGYLPKQNKIDGLQSCDPAKVSTSINLNRKKSFAI